MNNPELKAKPKEVTFFKLNNQVNIPVDGKIQLHKDKEAVKAYFLEYVNPNTVFFYDLKEKLDYLVDEQYIDKGMLDLYDFDFIKKLFKKVYNKKFRFESFLGAYKFYTQYAMRTNDGSRLLERYEDRVVFNALYLADGDKELAINLADEMVSRRFQPATPTYMNAGRKRAGELVSCFEVDFQDNMNSIGRGINSALQLSRIGGGVGNNLSNLRASGDPIKGIEGASSGVVPVMKLLEDSFSYSNQLGQRNGSGVVYLNVFHPDIISFLSTKKENADEKVRVKTLSLGVVVPDKFYELARKGETMYLFSPFDVERVYGTPFSYVDITKEYDNMVNNKEIKKSKVDARELELEISKLQQESGYPYILNVDTANRAENTKGKVIMSNLCSEILQAQTPSVVNGDQTYDVLGEDVSCNLASNNIVNMMKSPNFGTSVATAIRALTVVSDKTSIREVPTVRLGNENNHAVGLGAMGLHTYLAKNKMHYGSEESLQFVDAYFRTVRYYAMVASNAIAKEKGKTFVGFEDSDYANGTFFDTYIEEDYQLPKGKMERLFKNIGVPTAKDWANLKEAVAEHGLYNRYLMAIAPTGSISYVNETSASLQPIIQKVEERQEQKTGKTYYPTPGLSDETMPYLTSAYDMDMRKMIDVYASAQKHIDQGISMTLYLRSEIPEGLYEWKDGKSTKMTTRDLTILRHYAFRNGIKSIYYVRTYTDNEGESSVNECESCSI